MPVPPVFNSVSEAVAFILDHGTISDVLTPQQFARFAHFIYHWADSEATLPLLMLEFFRDEIKRLDSINRECCT